MSSDKRPLLGKRGLVIDDEALIALDLQGLLEDAGADVICLHSAGKVGATLNSEERFDFAVLDLHLGGGIESGLGIAGQLQERGIPFVFLSGLARIDPRLAQFDRPLIEKPYRPDLLLQTIARIVAAP